MEMDSFILSTLNDLREQAPRITMGKYRGQIQTNDLCAPAVSVRMLSSDSFKYPKPNYGPKMAVHLQCSCEGMSAMVLCQIRELIKTEARCSVGLFVGLLFSWISNLETRRTPHADSSTSLQEQKEGNKFKKRQEKVWNALG